MYGCKTPIHCYKTLSLFPLPVVVVIVVVHSSRLLLENYWVNFNQTWHKASLGEGDLSLHKQPFNSQILESDFLS